MEHFRKIKEHPNFDRICGGVEWKALKKEILLMFGIFGGLFVLILLVQMSVGSHSVSAREAIHTAMMILILIGLGFYYLYRVWELFWYIDRYSFSTVLFDKPHQGYRGTMYFTVEVLDRQGQTIRRNTRNLFHQGQPNFEEYLNKRVLVGYNDETDAVVVIQKME